MVELFEILLNLVESFFFLRRKGAVFVRYLCFTAQSVNEGNMRNETIFIFLVSQFIEKFCGVFLGDLLLCLELAVACIQAYVFTILRSLYLNELSGVEFN